MLDWYTFDFQEELSGLDGEAASVAQESSFAPDVLLAAGSLLHREATFVTRCMLVLEKQYAEVGGSPPFFLVGHSMGGLVAHVASADALLPHGPWRSSNGRRT